MWIRTKRTLSTSRLHQPVSLKTTLLLLQANQKSQSRRQRTLMWRRSHQMLRSPYHRKRF